MNTLFAAEPVSALDAAAALVADGHHVHYVSEAKTHCLSLGTDFVTPCRIEETAQL